MSIEIIISLIAALGVGGIIGALLNRQFEQQKQTDEHDIKIFNQSNEILAEQKLLNIIFQLIESHSLVREDSARLRKWCEFIEQTGNKYLDKSINKENQKLLDDLRELTKFISDNFDFWKRVENPLYLKPELDPDKFWDPDSGDVAPQDQVEEYNLYANELKILVEKIKKHYSEYRQVVKNKLRI